MQIGRNEPCPCGSGKKYKKCCFANTKVQKVEDFTYRRYRDIEFKLVDRLFRHASDVFGLTSMEEAWDEFHCWHDGERSDPNGPIIQIFGPYFLFSWEIDPADTDCDPAMEGKTVAESFLEAHRSQLSKEELEILEAANRPVFSFYEISEVSPGQGFLLRNVLTENEYEVTERAGAQGSAQGNVVFGAIFFVNGRYQTLGISPFLLPPLAIQNLIEIRKNLQKRLKTKKLSDEQVSDYDIELRDVYFSLLDQYRNPRMPKLCNSDGDPLVPQTLHFEIVDPAEAFSALQRLTAGVVTEDELRSHAKVKSGQIQEIEIPWFKKSKAINLSGSNTVMGTVKIVGQKMTAEVNSNKRATTLKKKILSALGSNVRFVTKVVESVEGNIGREKKGPTQSSPIPFHQLPPEAIEAVKKMAEAHWTKWFDEEIPALNGKTPKQAARSKEGRELLEALLNFYEQKSGQESNEATNLFQPDVQMLRLKLGLTKRT